MTIRNKVNGKKTLLNFSVISFYTTLLCYFVEIDCHSQSKIKGLQFFNEVNEQVNTTVFPFYLISRDNKNLILYDLTLFLFCKKKLNKYSQS